MCFRHVVVAQVHLSQPLCAVTARNDKRSNALAQIYDELVRQEWAQKAYRGEYLRASCVVILSSLLANR